MRSTFVNINGHRFHVALAGDPQKPAILMLHGFPEYCGAFFDLIPHLQEQLFCIVPDQRGYGQSWRPTDVDAFRLGKLVSDAAALVDQLAGGRVAAVLGHDWGASVAYGLAARNVAHIERLIIANGVHPIPFQRALAAGGAQSQASQYIHWLRAPDSEQQLVADNHAIMMALFSKHMDMTWLTDQKHHAYQQAWGTADQVQAMVNWYRASPLKVAAPGHPLPPVTLPDLPADQMRISMPHLLLWGENDTALLPESRAGLEDLCDDLTTCLIPDADHWLLHQKPAEIADHIRAFLCIS